MKPLALRVPGPLVAGPLSQRLLLSIILRVTLVQQPAELAQNLAARRRPSLDPEAFSASKSKIPFYVGMHHRSERCAVPLQFIILIRWTFRLMEASYIELLMARRSMRHP